MIWCRCLHESLTFAFERLVGQDVPIDVDGGTVKINAFSELRMPGSRIRISPEDFATCAYGRQVNDIVIEMYGKLLQVRYFSDFHHHHDPNPQGMPAHV